MKIGSSSLDNLNSLDGLARPAGSRATDKSATVARAGDQVAVSAAGAGLNTLSGSQDFDAKKVDAIRQAIREGRFTVNADAIADRLIADATALLGPRLSA